MNTEFLGNILEPSGTQRAGDGEFPILSITMHEGLVDQAQKFKKRIASSNTSTYRIVHRDELVVGFPIDEGVLGFQQLYPIGIVSPAYGIWRLKNPQEIHIPYLERYLRSDEARRIYASKMQGGVARRRNIKKDVFLGIQIPLPPLDEQKRIAAVLDKADALRRLRQQSLDLTEQLIQSVFLEMFGDPISNPKGWPTETFENWLESIESGWSPKCQKRKASTEEWGVLKLGAVTKCEFNESEQKALPADLDPRLHLEVKANDLLFGRKNTHQLVAATAYVWSVRPQLMISDLIFRLRLKHESKIEPKFLWRLLIHPSQRFQIQQLAGGAAGSMPNISKANLRKVVLIKPPIKLQKKFSVAVSLIHNQSVLLEEQKDVAERLFTSLQQRAFRGNLDLSKLILDEEAEEIIATPDKPNKLAHEPPPKMLDSGISLKALKPSAAIERKLKSQDKVIEADEQIPWSADYFKFRLLAKQAAKISITDLISQAESVFTEPNYDAIRDILFDCLDPAQGKALLTQTFDEERKEIILQHA